MNKYSALLLAFTVAGCSSSSDNNDPSNNDPSNNEPSNNSAADMSMSQPDGSSTNAGSPDGGGNSTSNNSSAGANTVRVNDLTPAGQGLALDAVQNCNQVGMACVGLMVVASSDDSVDYAGAEDGPNSQDDSCTDMTFTRLGGTGNWVELQRADAEPFASGSQLNVWTGDSACSLIEAGDKNFSVVLDGAELDSCQGTCTINVP